MTENLNIVYLYGFSPRHGNELSRLLPIVKTQSIDGAKIGFILIHDGVIGGSSRGKVSESMKELFSINLTIFAMIPDLKARGISLDYLDDKIKPIEYNELIDILDNSQKIVSWM